MKCSARHPEQDITCWQTSTHAEHAGFPESNPSLPPVFWDNAEFVPPPRPGKKGAQQDLANLAAKIKTEPTGKDLRDEGAEAVLLVETEAWKRAAEVGIRQLAASGNPFTAEDLRGLVGDPERTNSVGAFFLSASRRGLIQRAGTHVLAERTTRRGSEMPQWVGAQTAPLRNFD